MSPEMMELFEHLRKGEYPYLVVTKLWESLHKKQKKDFINSCIKNGVSHNLTKIKNAIYLFGNITLLVEEEGKLIGFKWELREDKDV